MLPCHSVRQDQYLMMHFAPLVGFGWRRGASSNPGPNSGGGGISNLEQQFEAEVSNGHKL